MSEIKEMNDPTLEVGDTVRMQYSPKYNSGWIPCAERLPPVGHRVLIYISTEHIIEIAAISARKYGGTLWFAPENFGWEDFEVSHWCELPEIPK